MKTIYKYLIVTSCILPVFTSLYGQIDLKPDATIYLNLGYDHTYINSNAFDKWTRGNYNLAEKFKDGVFFDIGCFFNRFDAGLDFVVGNRVTMFNFYFGRELTSRNSRISSWLNLGIGGYAYIPKNIAPLNYVLNPDEMGQTMELHYTAATLSLTSKNYLKIFRIKNKVQRKKVYMNSGFFVSAGYQFNTPTWRYGYYNTDTVYTARKVNTIPKLRNVQINAGVFIGI